MPEIEKEKKYEIINTDWIELIDTEHRKHILRRNRGLWWIYRIREQSKPI